MPGQPIPDLDALRAIPPIGGKDIARVTMSLTKAGDGLSEALKIDPIFYELDTEVYVVAKCKVGSYKVKPVKDTSYISLEHVLEAQEAFIVEGDLVAEIVAAQAERIRLAKEKAAGVTRIPFGDELQDAHQRGEHADGIVETCPDCDAEVEALEAERGE